MSASKRIRPLFFVVGFCLCLCLIAAIRYISEKKFFPGSYKEAVFYRNGECEDCRKISLKHWDEGALNDRNDLHIECAQMFGIQPFETNAELEANVDKLCREGKLREIKECDSYHLKNLTHSYPYLIPAAADLLDEISKRFENKLAELDIRPYTMMISSVLRTRESQDGLGKHNGNATKSVSAHMYGTTFDISYKEFLPLHGKPAPEGFCRHDLMRHPLAEVLTELCNEGRCRVVKESKQACYHITVMK